MNQESGAYRSMLECFLSKELTVEQFQAMFLTSFKNETRQLDESLFFLLDELFGDVDCYTSSPELLAEQQGFYIDEQTLRGKVRRTLDQML